MKILKYDIDNKNCQYYPEILRASAEMMDEGLQEFSTYVAGQNLLVAVSEEGSFMGVLIYTLYKNEDGCTINMGYVKKEFRKLGVYTKLYNKLKEVLPKTVKVIYSNTKITNTTMQEVYKKLNRPMTTINTYDKINREEESFEV